MPPNYLSIAGIWGQTTIPRTVFEIGEGRDLTLRRLRVEWLSRCHGVTAMPALLAELEQQVRTLSAEERAHLVEVLLESLQDTSLSEIESEWQMEIERRVAAYDRGEVQTYSAEDVFAEARRLSQ